MLSMASFSQNTDFRQLTVHSDTDSSSDEALPAQPVPPSPSPPLIPSAISTPATQEVPDVNLPADQYEPCKDTSPDPVLDSPTTGNDSDTCSLPRTSTRVRCPPPRYDGFIMDRNWLMNTRNSKLLTLSYGLQLCHPLAQRTWSFMISVTVTYLDLNWYLPCNQGTCYLFI